MNEADARIEIPDDGTNVIDAMTNEGDDRLDVIDAMPRRTAERTAPPAKGSEVVDDVIDRMDDRISQSVSRILSNGASHEGMDRPRPPYHPDAMPYREPPTEGHEPQTPSWPPTPRPPLSKATYWSGYSVALLLPILLAGVLAIDAMPATDDAARQPLLLGATALLAWGFGAFLGLHLWARVAGASWNKANTMAVRLMGEGQPEKAIAVLDEMLPRTRLFPVAYSLYLWNRGIATGQTGRFDEARAILTGVHAAHWFDRRLFKHFVPAVMVSLGKVEALAGHLDAAERWSREANAKLASASSATALPLAVLLAARRGKLDEAEALCASQWTAAEATLPARDVKLLRVLRAFVASRRAGVDRAEVDQWLAGAKPVPAGMFDYVGAAWPEFQAFARAEL